MITLVCDTARNISSYSTLTLAVY